MIGILRIRGGVRIKQELEQTLKLLGLRRKFAFTTIDEKNPAQMGMLKKIKDFVTYGKIDESFAKKVLGDKKSRGMAPPKGGFESSTRFSGDRGELGKREDLKELIERML